MLTKLKKVAMSFARRVLAWRILARCAFAALVFISGCHAEIYYKDGFEYNAKDQNDILSGDIPFLKSLSLKDASGTPLVFDTDFNSVVFVYESTLGNKEGTRLTINAEPGRPEWQISTNGDGLNIVAHTGEQAVIFVRSRKLVTTYIVSFFDGSLQNARISAVAFSPQAITIEPAFSPDVFVPASGYYTVTLPKGTKEVIVNAEPAQGDSFLTFNPAYKLVVGSNPVNLSIFAAAKNFNVSEYKFRLVVATTAGESFLDGWLQSEGCLAAGGDTDYVQFNKNLTTYKLLLPSNTTSYFIKGFADKPAATISYKKNGSDISYKNTITYAANDVITLTVNYGPGYDDKTYTFNVIKSSMSAALLTGIDITENSGTYKLYRLKQGGERNTADHTQSFETATTNYDALFSEQQMSWVSVTGTPEAGGSASYTWGGLSGIQRYWQPWAGTPALYILATASGKLPTLYTVRFDDPRIKPSARLSLIKLFGAKFSGTYLTFSPNTLNYTAESSYYSTAITAVGTPADSAFGIVYTPAGGALTPAQIDAMQGGTIRLTVNGGPAYTPTEYTLVIAGQALLKVLAVAVDPVNTGTIELVPAEVMTNGVAANTIIYAVLKPNSNKQISAAPVTISASPSTVTATGTVPLASSAASFWFAMPPNDITNVTGYFTDYAINNKLLSLAITNVSSYIASPTGTLTGGTLSWTSNVAFNIDLIASSGASVSITPALVTNTGNTPSLYYINPGESSGAPQLITSGTVKSLSGLVTGDIKTVVFRVVPTDGGLMNTYSITVRKN